MAITKEEIKGTKIICEIKSSNLKKATYDTETHDLIIEFNNGLLYEYQKVPHEVFVAMRRSESQGSFFSKNIGKKFNYKKLE
jgi:hypothetical protein